MTIILDILVLLIIGLSIFLAIKKGLIRTLFSLVGGLAAIVLAVSLSGPVSNWIDDKFVGPAVCKSVLTSINGSNPGKSYEEALKEVDVVGKLREMPKGLRKTLEKLNVNVEEVMAAADESEEASLAAKEKLIESIASPVSIKISKAIALIVLFIVFFVLLFFVTRLLDAVFRVLPFAKSINKVGGLIFGVVRAILIVMVFGALVHGLASGNILLSLEDLDNTILLKVINKINPILLIFK